MRLKSIFQKIMIPMVLIVCLLGGSILGIVGKLFTETYEQQIYEENSNTASFVSRSVGNFMDMAYRITQQLAYMNDIYSMDTKIQTPILKGTVERNDYFELIYIQDMNGDQTGRSSGELGNRAGRWWFTQMQETWEPFVSKSYYSVNTNMACASIFMPLEKNRRKVGILATDIKLEKIQESVAEFSDLDSGKITFIIDGEGVVVAHPESVYYEELYNYKNMTRTVTAKDAAGNVLYDDAGNIITEEEPIEISAEYQEMIKKVLAGESGQGLIADQGKEYYISYEPIAMDGVSDSWAVITLREKAAAMILMDQIIQAGIFATIVAVILAVILILLLTKSITKPIQYCLKRLTALSQGDLSTEVPVSRGRDEFAQLITALGETIQTLKGIIDDITVQLHQIENGDLTEKKVHTYGGEFDEIGRALKRINQSLNHSFRQVGGNARKVLHSANAFSDVAHSLAKDTALQASAVEEVTVSVQGASENSSSSAKTAQQVKEKMEQVNTDMICSNQSMNELLAVMNLIYEDSRKINGISKTIQDISFQTNLLSMNASVEAARAGEAGKGFSVIAGEIRELSEHCSKATADTSELIETTLKELEQGMVALKSAVMTIEKSAARTSEVNVLIGMISNEADEQMETMKQISNALEQISGVVQNNSAVAEESAASSVEMKENACRLQTAVQRYRC